MEHRQHQKEKDMMKVLERRMVQLCLDFMGSFDPRPPWSDKQLEEELEEATGTRSGQSTWSLQHYQSTPGHCTMTATATVGRATTLRVPPLLLTIVVARQNQGQLWDL
eukprot:scaffold103146_cov18-Tisochrysis_lutea.AAC.1